MQQATTQAKERRAASRQEKDLSCLARRYHVPTMHVFCTRVTGNEMGLRQIVPRLIGYNLTAPTSLKPVLASRLVMSESQPPHAAASPGEPLHVHMRMDMHQHRCNIGRNMSSSYSITCPRVALGGCLPDCFATSSFTISISRDGVSSAGKQTSGHQIYKIEQSSHNNLA